MDALQLEALRFGIAILAGGIVAVMAQRLAFGHALLLEANRRDRADSALLRALKLEIQENLLSIGAADGTRAPGSVGRTAWDAARVLALPDDVFATISRAYAIGTT